MNCCNDFGQCEQGHGCPARETIAGSDAANASALQQLLRHCRIKVDGVTYTGLFPTTCDAVSDAQDRFPSASRITAQVAA